MPEQARRRKPLSDRECEVLVLIALGYTNPMIAARLNVSVNTVKRHVANILGKLDVADRHAAASFYRSVMARSG